MKRFTDSIRKAIQAEDWYGALSTGLTLPDVCGRLISPNKGSKARYVEWFNEWMLHHYKTENRFGTHVFLHGEDCYALRCSYLHEGGANIEEQSAQKALNDFHFITPLPGMQIHCNQSNSTLQLQIDIFCHQIADAVDLWYESVNENKELIEKMKSLLVIHDSNNGIQF